MRDALCRALSRLGFHHVIACDTGAEVLTVLDREARVALIISDWNMAPMDGLALFAAIRKRSRFESLPFILVSAEAGPSRHSQAAQAGVSFFLPKPFDPTALSN